VPNSTNYSYLYLLVLDESLSIYILLFFRTAFGTALR
jgi:hypothetical protein